MKIFRSLSRMFFSLCFLATMGVGVAREIEFVSFSSANHPKAKGIHFTMDYPKSWKKEESQRPNVVGSFTSENGSGLESVVITIVDVPLPPGTAVTISDLRDIFSEEGIKEFVPEGAEILETRTTKIDGQMAGFAKFIAKHERANQKVVMHTRMFAVWFNGRILNIQYSVGGSDSPAVMKKLGEREKLFGPLFDLMANSIIIHSQYAGANR